MLGKLVDADKPYKVWMTSPSCKALLVRASCLLKNRQVAPSSHSRSLKPMLFGLEASCRVDPEGPCGSQRTS